MEKLGYNISKKNEGGVLKYPKKPIDLTDSEFRITVEKFPLVVVDCYANLCNPSKKLAPIIDNVAKTHAGKIVFGMINVNVNRVTANRFDIKSTPTLLIFKQGMLVDSIVGVVPRREIEKRIQPYLLENSKL